MAAGAAHRTEMMQMLYFSKHVALTCIGLRLFLPQMSRPWSRSSPGRCVGPAGARLVRAQPLRGNAEAAAIGKAAFNQSCAVCHGQDAGGTRSPAPDLRRIGMRAAGASRTRPCASAARATRDAFIKSVRYGKQKSGIVHMPPWIGLFAPELVWALRSLPKPRPRGTGIQSLSPTAAVTQ